MQPLSAERAVLSELFLYIEHTEHAAATAAASADCSSMCVLATLLVAFFTRLRGRHRYVAFVVGARLVTRQTRPHPLPDYCREALQNVSSFII